MTFLTSDVSEAGLFFYSPSYFSLLVPNVSPFNLKLRLTLSGQSTNSPPLFGTDDFHLNFLGLHEIPVEKVKVGGVCRAFSYEISFQVIQEAQLDLESGEFGGCFVKLMVLLWAKICKMILNLSNIFSFLKVYFPRCFAMASISSLSNSVSVSNSPPLGRI